MARPQYYRFFTADYLRDAAHLSLLEHGAYRRLIDIYMTTGEPLPFDLQRLYRLLHATSKEEQQAVQVVVDEFFHMEGQLLRHNRCDREICWQNATTAQAKAAIAKRWNREEENQALANARISDVNRTLYKPELESKRKKKTPLTPLTIPEWLPQESLLAFREHRAKLRRPMTDHAQRLLIRKLATLRASGMDPVKLIDIAIEHGWMTVYKSREQAEESGNETLRKLGLRL
jgi:uncharacterized protein YdaU (DUF1376 family)